MSRNFNKVNASHSPGKFPFFAQGYLRSIWGKAFGSVRSRYSTISVAIEGYKSSEPTDFTSYDIFRDYMDLSYEQQSDWIDAEYKGGIFSTQAISGSFLIFTSTDGTVSKTEFYDDYALKKNDWYIIEYNNYETKVYLKKPATVPQLLRDILFRRPNKFE